MVKNFKQYDVIKPSHNPSNNNGTAGMSSKGLSNVSGTPNGATPNGMPMMKTPGFTAGGGITPGQPENLIMQFNSNKQAD